MALFFNSRIPEPFMKRVWVDLNLLFFGREMLIVTALAEKLRLDQGYLKEVQTPAAACLNHALSGQINLKQAWHDLVPLFGVRLEEWPHEQFLDNLVECLELTPAWHAILDGLKRGQFTGAIVNHAHMHLGTLRAISKQSRFCFNGRITPHDTKGDYDLLGEESLIDHIYNISLEQNIPIDGSLIIGPRDRKLEKAGQYGFNTLCVMNGPYLDQVAVISQLRRIGARVQYEM